MEKGIEKGLDLTGAHATKIGFGFGFEFGAGLGTFLILTKRGVTINHR